MSEKDCISWPVIISLSFNLTILALVSFNNHAWFLSPLRQFISSFNEKNFTVDVAKWRYDVEWRCQSKDESDAKPFVFNVVAVVKATVEVAPVKIK